MCIIISKRVHISKREQFKPTSRSMGHSWIEGLDGSKSLKWDFERSGHCHRITRASISSLSRLEFASIVPRFRFRQQSPAIGCKFYLKRSQNSGIYFGEQRGAAYRTSTKAGRTGGSGREFIACMDFRSDRRAAPCVRERASFAAKLLCETFQLV